MSYILEALRKSERERLLSQAPTAPALIVDQAPRRQRWLPWLIVLLLSLNGTGLIYLWLSGWGNGGPTAEPSGVAQTAGRAETPEKTSIVAETKEPGRKSELQETEGATIDEPVIAQSENKPPVREPTTSAAQTDTPGLSAPKSPATVAKPAPTKKPARRAQAKDSAAPDDATPEESGNERGGRLAAFEDWPPRADSPSPAPVTATLEPPPIRSSRPAVPLLREMPESFQQRIPAIRVNVLAYSSVPAERFAVIDMVKYSKGDRLPSGAILADIQPDGLILELDGTRFRLPQ